MKACCTYFLASLLRITVVIGFMCCAQSTQAQTHVRENAPVYRLAPPAHRDTLTTKEHLRIGRQLLISMPDSARMHLEYALLLSKSQGYTYGTTIALARLGELRINQGKYDQALEVLREAMIYAPQSAHGLQELSTLYNDIGRVLVYKGSYEQAIAYLHQAIRITEKYPSAYNRINLGGIYNNIGMALNHMEASDSAASAKVLYYLDLAERIARKEQNHNLTATILGNKGVIYLQQKKWDHSLESFLDALEMARQYNLPKIAIGILNNIGDYYLSRSMPEKALPYLHEALAVKGTINPYYRITASSSLGQAYMATGRYREAEETLLGALNLAESLRIEVSTVLVHKALTDLYERNGNPTLAYRHYKKYVRLKDSLSSEQVKKNAYLVDLKYKASQKDKVLLEKELMIVRQKSNLQRKNLWISISLTGIGILAILLVSVFRIDRHKQNLQNEKIRTLQREQEISQLKAIMQGEEQERARLARELHDGIGSQLAAIKMNFASITKDNPELDHIYGVQDIISRINQTSEDVRNTAHNLMPDILTRYGLAEALMLYCSQISRPGPLQIDLQTYGNLDELNEYFTLLLYRMIQELVQNILKHARADHAVIQIRKEDQRINIVVEDNGTGFDLDAARDGLGLQQLASRIRSLHGEMLIDSGGAGAGTVVYIELNCSPLEKRPA